MINTPFSEITVANSKILIYFVDIYAEGPSLMRCPLTL